MGHVKHYLSTGRREYVESEPVQESRPDREMMIRDLTNILNDSEAIYNKNIRPNSTDLTQQAN